MSKKRDEKHFLVDIEKLDGAPVPAAKKRAISSATASPEFFAVTTDSLNG